MHTPETPPSSNELLTSLLAVDSHPATLSRSELREVLTTALQAGQIMLENGANTARVEEAIHRLGIALGASSLDIYVTPSGIMATAYSGHEHRTRILRILSTGVDLSRVAQVLDVSRHAEQGELDIHQVRAALDRIAKHQRLYNPLITSLGVGVACAALAFLFGGTYTEVALTLIVASITQYFRFLLLRTPLSRLLVTSLSAAFGAGLAIIVVALLAPLLASPPSAPLVVLATIILLIPGVPLVSSTADLFRGDILSGMARAMQAAMQVFAIGVGVWALLLITKINMTFVTASQQNLPLALLAAFITAAGFGILFDVPHRSLVWGALVGCAAYAVRTAALADGLPPEVASFLAGLLIGVLAEVLARIQQTPTAIFSIPGFIPLVPGAIAFSAVLSFVNGDYVNGIASVTRATLIIIAIASGFGTVQSLARMRQH